jgi:ATPase family AAA domain-containing protein 3A/B
MSIPWLSRRYSRVWYIGGAAVAAAALAPKTALADSKKKEDGPGGPYFDPEALERGAKALREINASPYAKQV